MSRLWLYVRKFGNIGQILNPNIEDNIYKHMLEVVFIFFYNKKNDATNTKTERSYLLGNI